MYLCFHCKEQHSLYECKHTQQPAFRKESFGKKTKRMFRWLGTKSYKKNSRSNDTSNSQTFDLGVQQQQYSEYESNYFEGRERSVSLGHETAASLLPELSDSPLIELGDKESRIEHNSYSRGLHSQNSSSWNSSSQNPHPQGVYSQASNLGVQQQQYSEYESNNFEGRDADFQNSPAELPDLYSLNYKPGQEGYPLGYSDISSIRRSMSQFESSGTLYLAPHEVNRPFQPQIPPLITSGVALNLNETSPISPNESVITNSIISPSLTFNSSPSSLDEGRKAQISPITPTSLAENAKRFAWGCSVPNLEPAKADDRPSAANESPSKFTDWSSPEYVTRDLDNVPRSHIGTTCNTEIGSPAKKRKSYSRPQTPEATDSPEPGSETIFSPPALTPGTLSPMTLSPSSESEQNSCYCGFRPMGDPKWHSSNFKRHIKIHLKDRVPCGYNGCSKTYSRSDNLNQHRREKHPHKRHCNRDG